MGQTSHSPLLYLYDPLMGQTSHCLLCYICRIPWWDKHHSVLCYTPTTMEAESRQKDFQNCPSCKCVRVCVLCVSMLVYCGMCVQPSLSVAFFGVLHMKSLRDMLSNHWHHCSKHSQWFINILDLELKLSVMSLFQPTGLFNKCSINKTNVHGFPELQRRPNMWSWWVQLYINAL